jgi:flagellar protein FlgJ
MNEVIFNSINLNPVNEVSGSSDKSKAELKKVAEEFEAIFIGQLLKIMRETIEEANPEGGGFGKSVYTELFDQEGALSMARRGALGIGDIIYKSFADREADDNPAPGQAVAGSSMEVSNNASESASEIPGFSLPVDAPVSSGFDRRKDQ